MTRQQEAEKRLASWLHREQLFFSFGSISSSLQFIASLRLAITADPTLLEAFGEHRSQTIAQAAHGSSALTDLERAQIAAQFDDECGSVTGSMKGDGND